MSKASSFFNRHAALVFALRTFAAAMLAFAIALRLDMPRPYWAMASVYITSNQLVGATWSKAAYRLLGTLIGAAGTIVLVPNLVNAPELLSLAIALWVGLFLYFSLIDGTPRSYVFMLSGYTVALLGLPVLSMPGSTFDLVVARVQEIMLGIVCAGVVSMLVLPRTVASTIAAQTDAWLAGARRLGMDILTGTGSDTDRDSERVRLASATSEIDQLCRHLDYETATSANTARALRRLRQHMLSLLPLLASIEDQRIALASHESAPARIAQVSARAARWLADGGQNGPEADDLHAAFDHAQPALGVDAGWNEIVIARYVIQLRQLMDVMSDCRSLREAIADGRDPDTVPLAFTPDAVSPPVLHRDYGLTLWAAAATTLSVLVCCAFWIATGWTDGATAAIFAAVVGSFVAAVDDPLPAFRNFAVVFLAVIAIHGVYTFGVLPRITTFEMLIAALMPAFVLFGWMAARPATARAGSLLAIFTSVQLALNSSYEGDFAAYANSSVSLMVGVGLTAVVFGIVRAFGADWIASRLLRDNWKTLATVAGHTARQDRVEVASLMQHRLALLAARIAVVPAEAKRDAAQLRQLRTALSIINLQQATAGLSHLATAEIDKLLEHLATAFRAAGALPDELLEQLDGTIASTAHEAPSKNRNDALVGLAGLRAGLFPEAGPYEPHEERRAAA